MQKVKELDQNFAVLANYVEGNEIPISELSQSIISLRQSINLQWYTQFVQYNHIQCLTCIFKVLFELLNNEDPGIRISITSTLGSIIFLLGPFVPKSVIVAFLSAVQEITPSPHVSIAIVGCFCHITHIVSPINVQSFISSLPIIHHFGSDVVDYLKYLPKLFKSMLPIDIEFLRFLLRTMLISFGETPTIPFISSVMSLLKHQPNYLFADLMQYIENKSLKFTMLMLAPHILRNKQLTKYIPDDYSSKIFQIALSSISDNKTPLSEFEEACETLVSILEFSKQGEMKERLRLLEEKINNDFPPHYKLYMLKISNSFEELIPIESDTLLIKSNKLIALSYFLSRNPTIDNMKRIMTVFSQYIYSEGELYSKLLESLSRSNKLLTKEYIKDIELSKLLSDIISQALEKPNGNWVQKIALLRFIESIQPEIGIELSPQFETKSIEIIFKFCLSKQNHLSNKALQIFPNIVTARTIPIVMSLILMRSDFFTDNVFLKLIKIINSLVNLISQANIICLESLVCESMMISDTIPVIGEGFKFLNFIKSEHEVEKMRNIAFELISKIYKSFTGKDSINCSNSYIEPLDPISSITDTDILSFSFDQQSCMISTLHECVKYVTRNPIENETFTQLVVQLLKLFPIESLSVLKNRSQSRFISTPEYPKILTDILQTTSHIKIAARCAEVLASYANKESEAFACIVAFIGENHVSNGRDLFYFWQYLSQIDSDYANDICDKALTKFSSQNQFLFRFLQSEEKEELIKQTRFVEMPLFDEEFKSYFIENMDLLTKIDDDYEFDDECENFLYRYTDYFNGHYDKKYSLNISSYHVMDISNIEKSASAAPFLVKGEMILSLPLLFNFFTFSTHTITKELIQDCFQFIKENGRPKHIAALIEYAAGKGIDLDKDIIESSRNIQSYYTKLALAKYDLKFSKQELTKTNIDHSVFMKLNIVPNEADTLVLMNPTLYFSVFIKSYVFKSKSTRALCIFINRYSIDLNLICKFLEKQIAKIANISSIKKLLFFLRFIELFFAKLYAIYQTDKNLMPDISSFIDALFGSLHFLSTSQISSIHNEVSRVFTWLQFFFKPNQDLVAYIDNYTRIYGTDLSYLSPSAGCVSFSGITPSSFTNDNIMKLLYSQIPSHSLVLLRVQETLLHPTASQQIMKFYSTFQSSICGVFQQFLSNPMFNFEFMHLLNIVSYRPQLFQGILSGLTNIANKEQTADGKLLASKILDVSKPKAAKADLVSTLTKEFVASPSFETGNRLNLAIQRNFQLLDCILLIVGKIVVIPYKFLEIYVLLAQLMKKMPFETMESDKIVVQTMVNSLKLGKRGEVLNMLLTGDNDQIWKGALLAAELDCL